MPKSGASNARPGAAGGGTQAPLSGGNPAAPGATTAEKIVSASAPFQQKVLAAAGLVPDSGRFGEQKVFIADAHKAYEAAYGKIPIDTFKQRLVNANTQGTLRLVRADLVEAMNPAQVKASHVSHLNADFHFIKLPHKWDAKR